MKVLGKTGLEVFEIGCGGIPIQRITQAEVSLMVDAMVENKVNFIDSARGYSNSEELFGEALKGRRKKFILATKSMSRSYEAMKKDIEISLNNFQTDYIDIYQLHNVSINEDYSGAYRALVEAKSQGKVRHIGVTTHSLEFLKKAIDEDVFETIQFPYNIIERQAEKTFCDASNKNIGIIVMKPLAGGAIDCVETALKFLLKNNTIDVIIPGMESARQVYQNCSCVSQEYTEQDIENENNIVKTLNTDFCRRCGYCMPCAVGINIPFSFLCEGYFSRYNLKEWSKERYNAMKVKPSSCIECGVCEKKCPYNLKIREKLKKVVSIMEDNCEN